MKNFIILFSFSLLMISCGKKEVEQEILTKENLTPPYDTIAIDSFSAGATSVDVARQIKISSASYQDSLKEIAKKIEAEKLLKKETEEKEKAEKTLETEKKKTEEAKKKAVEPAISEPTTNP